MTPDIDLSTYEVGTNEHGGRSLWQRTEDGEREVISWANREVLDVLAAALAVVEEAEARAHNAEADYDRRGERLWRLAATAGYVPHESDNDATAELAVTEALAAVEQWQAAAENRASQRDQFADKARRAEVKVAAGLALAEEWEANYRRWINVSDGPRVKIFHAHATRLRAALDPAPDRAQDSEPRLPFTLRMPTDRSPDRDEDAVNQGVRHVDVQVIHDPGMDLLGECRQGYGGPVIALREWNEQVFLHELLHAATAYAQPLIATAYPPHGHEVISRIEVALWETGWRFVPDRAQGDGRAGLLPCCRGEGECAAPADIGPCAPVGDGRADS